MLIAFQIEHYYKKNIFIFNLPLLLQDPDMSITQDGFGLYQDEDPDGSADFWSAGSGIFFIGSGSNL